MTFTLFELSQNQAVQDKARVNVKKMLAKHDGLFTYEALMEMTYVENCISGINKIVINFELIKILFLSSCQQNH